MSQVTVAIVPREGFTFALRSLESLYASSAIPFETLFVDGAAPWPVSRALRADAKRRGFRLLRIPRFLTPNEARNIAYAHCTAEYIVFADNDLLYAPGCLERLVETADATGAALVGPIVCVGDEHEAPFGEVHGARGSGRIVETNGMRRLEEQHPYADRPLAEVQREVFTEPCELLEFHCILVRRSILERIGGFDEGLKSALEHVDFAFSVRRAGGLIYIEPRAVVHQILPPRFPRGALSLPYLRKRWSPEWNEASLRHFRTKWQLTPENSGLEGHAAWLAARRSFVFRANSAETEVP